MDLILFGIQGSGKGTLAKAISEKFNMSIFETGAELRKLSQEDSELGQKVKSIIESGHLVPNEVVMEIVENFIQHIQPHQSIIFDGIPRQMHQAQTLNELLKTHNREFKALMLEISEETAIKRLTARQRNDDTPEVIKKRIDIFKNETLPAIETYKENLLVLDGEPDIETVRENGLQLLESIISI